MLDCLQVSDIFLALVANDLNLRPRLAIFAAISSLVRVLVGGHTTWMHAGLLRGNAVFDISGRVDTITRHAHVIAVRNFKARLVDNVVLNGCQGVIRGVRVIGLTQFELVERH